MEEFSHNTKIVILKVLNDIIHADNVVHEKEVEYYEELVHQFGLDNNYKTEINALTTFQALSMLNQIEEKQKELVASMMGKMIVVDKDINYNEVKLYNIICDSCLINKGFCIDDYSGVSISGPFVNPEDIK